MKNQAEQTLNERIGRSRISEMMLAWASEKTSVPAWRENLTEDERELVALWDKSYAEQNGAVKFRGGAVV